MRRRTYLRSVGASMSIGVSIIAGCGAPGSETSTETEVSTSERGTTAAGETATESDTTQGTERTETAASPTATGTGAETSTETGANTSSGTQASNTIHMVTKGSQYYFDPIGLLVDSGAKVTWKIQAGSHSSTAYVKDNPEASVRRIPEDADGWNSEILSGNGSTYSHTFDTTGTYDYYCIPHKSLGMVGRIVVDKPSDLGGNPPDGKVPSEQDIVDKGTVSYDEFNSG